MRRDVWVVLACLAAGTVIGWFGRARKLRIKIWLWNHARWFRRLVTLRRLAVVLIAGTIVPTKGTAQEREVRFTPSARAYLAAQWDTVHANQVERGYCLLVMPAIDELPSDTIDVVVGAFRAVARVANPVQTSFNCGPRMRYLHIHTPTTCDAIMPHPNPILPGQMRVADCRLGGPGNGVCFPSQGDIGMLRNYEQPWGVIQCAADAFIVFYPETAGHLYP